MTPNILNKIWQTDRVLRDTFLYTEKCTSTVQTTKCNYTHLACLHNTCVCSTDAIVLCLRDCKNHQIRITFLYNITCAVRFKTDSTRNFQTKICSLSCELYQSCNCTAWENWKMCGGCTMRIPGTVYRAENLYMWFIDCNVSTNESMKQG